MAFNLWNLRKHFRKKKILVLGDSHAEIFDNPLISKKFCKYKLRNCSVPGATVSGLSNPNSKTQALPLFEAAYKETRPDYTIFLLGEVDVGFVLWYRAEKYNISVRKLLYNTIENYQALVLSTLGVEGTIIISAPLPTIKDNQSWGEVANARKEIKKSQKERTALTLEFNRIMSEWAFSQNIDFINLDTESLGTNGLVSEYLLNANQFDHHYDPDAYAQMLREYLYKYLD